MKFDNHLLNISHIHNIFRCISTQLLFNLTNLKRDTERNIGQFLNYRAIQDWWKFWRKSTAGNFSRRWTPWRTWWPPSELTRLCTQLSRLWSTQAMRLVTNEQTYEKASKPKNKPKTNEKIKNQKANRQTLCCYSHNY